MLEEPLDVVFLEALLCKDGRKILPVLHEVVVPFMALGAKGVISAASNIIPEVMVEMAQLCLRNKFEAAAKLQIENTDLIDALFAEVNPIPVKAAMHLFGMCSEYVRPPLCPSSQSALTTLKSALSKAGLY